MRVLVTGAGGELGTHAAMLLEQEPAVEQLEGVDLDPPRRRLRRLVFHRIEPRDRARTVEVVRALRPTAVVHLGVYEPDARSTPAAAADRTAAAAESVLNAAAAAGSLERIVLRSGLEVYGRGRGAATVPAEDARPAPRTGFGRSLLDVERSAAAAAARCGARLTVLRLAPVVGPHVPSPLGRVLRLPVVPFSALADPPFSVIHREDAAAAAVRALVADVEGTFNVVAPGAVTAGQASRLGSRVPMPVVGPGWALARRLADLLGAPVPEHVLELLRRGRTADGTAAAQVLGFRPALTTPEVIRDLYEWAPVTHLRAVGDAA